MRETQQAEPEHTLVLAQQVQLDRGGPARPDRVQFANRSGTVGVAKRNL
jgi:hypothetical protein